MTTHDISYKHIFSHVEVVEDLLRGFVHEATELQEIDHMLAERVVEWTEKWKQQGLQQGIQEGVQRGMLQGFQQGETTLLRRQLTRRFGPLPDWAETRLAQATTNQCEEWADRLLDADSLEGVLGPFD